MSCNSGPVLAQNIKYADNELRLFRLGPANTKLKVILHYKREAKEPEGVICIPKSLESIFVLGGKYWNEFCSH